VILYITLSVYCKKKLGEVIISPGSELIILLKETRKQAREVFNTLNTVPHGRLPAYKFENLSFYKSLFKPFLVSVSFARK